MGLATSRLNYKNNLIILQFLKNSTDYEGMWFLLSIPGIMIVGTIVFALVVVVIKKCKKKTPEGDLQPKGPFINAVSQKNRFWHVFSVKIQEKAQLNFI